MGLKFKALKIWITTPTMKVVSSHEVIIAPKDHSSDSNTEKSRRSVKQSLHDQQVTSDHLGVIINNQHNYSWWFQPLSKILVKMGIFPK